MEEEIEVAISWVKLLQLSGPLWVQIMELDLRQSSNGTEEQKKRYSLNMLAASG